MGRSLCLQAQIDVTIRLLCLLASLETCEAIITKKCYNTIVFTEYIQFTTDLLGSMNRLAVIIETPYINAVVTYIAFAQEV